MPGECIYKDVKCMKTAREPIGSECSEAVASLHPSPKIVLPKSDRLFRCPEAQALGRAQRIPHSWTPHFFCGDTPRSDDLVIAIIEQAWWRCAPGPAYRVRNTAPMSAIRFTEDLIWQRFSARLVFRKA